MRIEFYGVRGSTPVSSSDNRRYGSNTSSVVLTAPGADPLLFDLGTGVRRYGEEAPLEWPFRGHALVTHLHWDHVQGLPFFPPLLVEGAELDVWGPPPEEASSLAEAFDAFMRPPYFPVGIEDLPGTVRFHDLPEGACDIGGARVVARSVPHLGRTYAFRVQVGDGPVVVYLPDHQQPLDGSLYVDPGVVELCAGADVLIHDAQFTAEEFAARPHWGHCTSEFAVAVAAAAGVSRLVLFHHDPSRTDGDLDREVERVASLPAAASLDEVLGAQEGLSIDLAFGEVPSLRG